MYKLHGKCGINDYCRQGIVMKKQLIENSQNKFVSEVFRLSPNPIAITDEYGAYVEVNEAFVEYFRLQPQEVIGKTSVESKIATNQERLNLLHEIKKNGYAKNFPMNVVTRDHEIRCLLLNTKPFKIKKKNYTLTICTDIPLFGVKNKNKRDSIFMKALDSVEGTGFILLIDNEKNPILLYVNKEQKLF
jgi:PAS domain S-box-containing protein